jgi:hypothetical protein
MKELIKHKTVIVELLTFYKEKYGNPEDFIKLNFTFQIGIYLEFLAMKGLGIHVDRYSYVIFYLFPENEKEKLSSMYKISNSFYIKESYFTDPVELFTNYKLAIGDAFAFLEIPY